METTKQQAEIEKMLNERNETEERCEDVLKAIDTLGISDVVEVSDTTTRLLRIQKAINLLYSNFDLLTNGFDEEDAEMDDMYRKFDDMLQQRIFDNMIGTNLEAREVVL